MRFQIGSPLWEKRIFPIPMRVAGRSAAIGIRRLLESISGAKAASFLAVLKTFGKEGLGDLSFAAGVTLSLIFQQWRRPRIRGEFRRFDTRSWGRGIAKDATLTAERFALMYPKLIISRHCRATIRNAFSLVVAAPNSADPVMTAGKDQNMGRLRRVFVHRTGVRCDGRGRSNVVLAGRDLEDLERTATDIQPLRCNRRLCAFDADAGSHDAPVRCWLSASVGRIALFDLCRNRRKLMMIVSWDAKLSMSTKGRSQFSRVWRHC